MTTDEAIDTTAVVVSEPVTPALFGTTEPVEIVAKARDVANALKGVIRSQGLISNIQGREYVRVEGWTLLGTMLGVFPVNVWTREKENGWEARVEARNMQGVVLGAAEAECTRDERTWSGRDSYALRSMAQTRATSKALRMPLGFVVTLAGFEATPAEEMTFANDAPKQREIPQVAPPHCPDHGLTKFVKGGIRQSGPKKGEPYRAFYACRDDKCTRGSKGKGFYVDAGEWETNQKQLAAKREGTPDYEDVPSE